MSDTEASLVRHDDTAVRDTSWTCRIGRLLLQRGHSHDVTFQRRVETSLGHDEQTRYLSDQLRPSSGRELHEKAKPEPRRLSHGPSRAHVDPSLKCTSLLSISVTDILQNGMFARRRMSVFRGRRDGLMARLAKRLRLRAMGFDFSTSSAQPQS